MSNATLEEIKEAKRMLGNMPRGARWTGVIVENASLTVSRVRDRTWRERLLSWPWRPWQKAVVWSEPDPNYYMMDTGNLHLMGTNVEPGPQVLVAHPATAARLRAELSESQGVSKQ